MNLLMLLIVQAKGHGHGSNMNSQTNRTIRRLEPCPTGSFASNSSELCSLCPPGFYQDQQGQTLCRECNTTLFSGFGANTAIHRPSDFEDGQPFCAFRGFGSSSSSELTEAFSDHLVHSTSGSHAPLIFSNSPSTNPSISPSRFLGPPEHMSIFPSHAPFVDLDGATAFDQNVCSDGSMSLHGDCMVCPVRTHWSLILAYCLTVFILGMLLCFACPAFLFCSLDFYQSIGLVSLVRKVNWVRPLSPVLRQLEYWAALDWLGVFPCITSSIQGSRLVLIALPFLVATLPLDICQMLAAFQSCCKSYSIAQEWIHRFTYQWSILLLLVTLQSVTVTIAEAILCQGIEGGLFCLDGASWIDRAIPFAAVVIGVFHVAWLFIVIWRKRHVTDSIIQRIFRHWLWPVDFMVRKVAIVVIVFVWDGSKALHLIVAITVGSGVLHLCLRPYGNEGRQGLCNGLVSISFMIALLLLSLIITLEDQFPMSSNVRAIALGSLVIALLFGPFMLGLCWYSMKRSKKVDSIADDKIMETPVLEASSHDEENGQKVDKDVYADFYRLEELGQSR